MKKLLSLVMVFCVISFVLLQLASPASANTYSFAFAVTNIPGGVVYEMRPPVAATGVTVALLAVATQADVQVAPLVGKNAGQWNAWAPQLICTTNDAITTNMPIWTGVAVASGGVTSQFTCAGSRIMLRTTNSFHNRITVTWSD